MMDPPDLIDEVVMQERWAEDEELMMDVDMTTELQQEVYQQVPPCCHGEKEEYCIKYIRLTSGALYM